MRRKKIEFLHKRKTTGIGKSFMQNRIKSKKYFSALVCRKLRHLQQSKTDLSKKQKKEASKKRYSTSFRNSHPKVLYKKSVLKSFTTYLFAYYWNRHQVVNKNLSICQNPNIRKTVLSSIFYFEKVLLFWRSVNKNVLEWFLLITSKEYTLYIHWPDLQTFFVETIPCYIFD